MKLRIFILLSFLLHLVAGIWFLQKRASLSVKDLAAIEMLEISKSSASQSGEARKASARKVIKVAALPSEKISQPLKEIENPQASISSAEAFSSASAANSFEPLNVGTVTVAPRLIFKKKVPYPSSAGRAGVEGVVDLKIVVDQEGRVKEAELVRGPGYGLDEAALAAVKECLFSPAQLGNEKVPVRMGFKYEFTLGGR